MRAVLCADTEVHMSEPMLRLVGSFDPVTPVLLDTKEGYRKEEASGVQESHLRLYSGLARKLELLCLRLQRVWADEHGSENFPLPVRAAMVELGLEDTARNRMAVWRLLNVRFVNEGFLAVVHHGKAGSAPDANLYRVIHPKA